MEETKEGENGPFERSASAGLQLTQCRQPGRETKIKIKQERRYDGSLLRLFKSDFFNVHMLIRYLYQHEGTGTQDYLINVLYGEDLYDIDFYLPQLCYLCLIKPEPRSIEKFVLDMSLKY